MSWTPEEARALMVYWEQTLTADEQIRIGCLDRINVYLAPKVDLPWYVRPQYEHLPLEILKELASTLPTLPPITDDDRKAYIYNWYKALSDETKNFYTFRWERVQDADYEALYYLMKVGEHLSRTKKKAEKDARKKQHFKEQSNGPDVENEALGEAGRGNRSEGAGSGG